MPLSNKEKQAEFRKRRADAKESEVRGIYAIETDHAKIKAYAKKIKKKTKDT